MFSTLTFNQIILYVMSICLIIGAIDYFRENKWGLGKRFEDGLNSFGALFIMMGGVLALAPLISIYAIPAMRPFFAMCHLDPGIVPGMLLANDCGAYQLSMSVCQNEQAGQLGGMLIGSVMGVNIIFNIPVALGMTPKERHGDMALGFLFGFMALPVGCVLGGLATRIPLVYLLLQLIPVFIVSLLIGILLRLFPNGIVKCFTILGKVISFMALAGIIVAIVGKLCDFDSHLPLDKVDNCITIVGTVIIVLPGAYVFVTLLSRIFNRLFEKVGQRLGINQSSVLGFIASLANTLATFAIVKDMDRKGTVMNFAFLTSASFAFADHLAFCTAFAPDLLVPMLVTKLSAAILGTLFVMMYFKTSHTTENAR